jgi:hypothetical protein
VVRLYRTFSVSPSKVIPSGSISTAFRSPCFSTRPATHASYRSVSARRTTFSASAGSTYAANPAPMLNVA